MSLFNAGLAAYLGALVCAVLYLMSSRRLFDLLANVMMAAGVVLQTVFIGLRWAEAGRAPFSNMFESLVLFAWSVSVIYLVIRAQRNIPWLAAAAAVFCAGALAHASSYETVIKPLMPALQSNWLTFHVMTCFLGYGGFAVSSLVAIGYFSTTPGGRRRLETFWGGVITVIIISFLIVLGYLVEKSKLTWFTPVMAGCIIVSVSTVYLLLIRKVGLVSGETEEVLDEVLARTISFGFLFLTLGILTGAVWANAAWGTYWSWDKKETWSLITWFIYAIFLHCRFMRGWRGAPAALISIFGFLSVLVTYFGVNFLMDGLHSYGSR